MPLVDRHVDRFAHRAALVQVGQVVDQLHGVLEVDGAVPATVVEVEHER